MTKSRCHIRIPFRDLLAAVALVWVAAPAFAQNVTFSATVRPAVVAAGEQFEYVLTLEGSDVGGAGAPKTPDFSRFVLLSGPNQSTSMQWINGRSSASITFSYVLYAREPGKYTIGPATITLKGGTLSSQSVQIEVTKGKPNQTAPSNQQPSVAASIGDNLLLRAVPDRQRVRRGEQVTVTYKLYNNIEISQLRQKKEPTVEGFWSEDISSATQLTYTTETLNGKRYRVAVIRTIALFPTQAGTHTVGPFEVTCGVYLRRQQRSNDPFDAFFNDPFFQQMQSVDYDLKSNPLTITVDPLPGSAPEGFSGAVGRFGLASSVDRKTVRAGEPVTLRVTVSGTGNVRLLTLPKPELPADIEAYDPKISDEVTRDKGIIRGRKTAEYLLVPRNQGQRTIEPMAFIYFDTDRNEYVTLRSQRFELTVEQGKDFGAAGSSIAAKEDVRLLGEDIRFLKLDIGRVQRSDENASAIPLVLGLAVPPFLFVAAFAYRRRLERIRGDMPRLLFERAGRTAAKRLKKARALLDKGDSEAYHAEVLRTLTHYLEHKLRIPPATFTFDSALEQLRKGGVAEETVALLRSCVERAEFVRYAPSSDTTEARKDLLDLAAGAINGIDQSYVGTRSS